MKARAGMRVGANQRMRWPGAWSLHALAQGLVDTRMIAEDEQ